MILYLFIYMLFVIFLVYLNNIKLGFFNTIINVLYIFFLSFIFVSLLLLAKILFIVYYMGFKITKYNLVIFFTLIIFFIYFFYVYLNKIFLNNNINKIEKFLYNFKIRIFYLFDFSVLNYFFKKKIKKYIIYYKKIGKLNLSLEQKVDEKILEYNTLLNKQREFIQITSHEIKSPVSSVIFQLDSLIDNIEEKRGSKNILQNLQNINNQLVKLGNLINKIFTVEKYDIKEIKLFIEKIDLIDLIIDEIENFKKTHKNIEISLQKEENIGNIEIDKVQFIQVFNNLLNNAVKFTNKKNSKINILCNKFNKDNILIKIEDNGIGFNDVDVKNIFNRYETGGFSTIGMGLGLYLCKKIISMHNGIIKAEKSELLGGASLIIQIPIKYKEKIYNS